MKTKVVIVENLVLLANIVVSIFATWFYVTGAGSGYFISATVYLLLSTYSWSNCFRFVALTYANKTS